MPGRAGSLRNQEPRAGQARGSWLRLLGLPMREAVSDAVEAWAVGPGLLCGLDVFRPARILDLLSRQRWLAGCTDLLGELVEVTVGTLDRGGVQLLGLVDVRGPARLLDLLNVQQRLAFGRAVLHGLVQLPVGTLDASGQRLLGLLVEL